MFGVGCKKLSHKESPKDAHTVLRGTATKDSVSIWVSSWGGQHKLWWNCEETKMVISASIDKSQTVRNHKYYKTQVLTNTNYDKTQIVKKHKIMKKNQLCQNTIFYQKNVTNSKCDSSQIMTQLKLWQNSNWDNNLLLKFFLQT